MMKKYVPCTPKINKRTARHLFESLPGLYHPFLVVAITFGYYLSINMKSYLDLFGIIFILH
jgi:uncharacterized membrane protein